MPRMFIFGLGYTAQVIAARLEARGWEIVSTGHEGTLAFDDEGSVRVAITDADHVLSSVPPGREARGEPLDAVLERYGDALKGKALSYLSSTGVYGDAGGAWVDESAPVGTGRRTTRSEADAAWLTLGARVYRLPGIYGPGRSMLERVVEGRAHRIDLPGQVFSRVHVEDIAAGVIAGLQAPPGAYNLADDLPCSQNRVVEEACRLLGIAPPPLRTLEEAGLSPMARGFYAENRRVANGKARRVLGWRPRYPDYAAGLRALRATMSPTIASMAPETATGVQR
ncbi:SDR family NAD(P)-dependent oxidoreductase [Novosphingobium mangrovi (ex Huang et al. 2023)]|uniref:SDR family NAD(P)-dependent oxidoreductase n=1 Tax=Novosphingobium mangrovi (ex Huang et al. 2023) TaxID=2976432 RepID=A0ABT2I180_9SPHN|nr:SDR family NAD(P)-dependent oxidoreductase [Novosphingobium mangrovi (ex Huang et al. 2023)]MCT2398556.1 SDR family NAD(P)-dependent oxidoreductase [Novosphingobium mangrovi (ex Huang et al. 2023)]